MSDEGEEPSPRTKRKIKKVMVLSSASESDSDDSQPATSTRKKRLRVLSEDGSDSSSGSWALGALRRRRALPGLRDSSGDSDSSGWGSDSPPGPSAAPSSEPGTSKSSPNKAPTAVSGFSSDNSEGNSEKCSICLMRFLNQEVGIPQNCEHIFCLDCITEWSRNMNTCPVDRIRFESIVVRTCAGGRVLRTEPVQVLERPPSVETMLIEDLTICVICRSTEREESMLLCDGCDLGYHMQCLTPPLTRIPEDQWLCVNCNGVWRSSPVTFQFDALGGSGLERARWEGPARGDEQPSTSSGRRRAAPAPRALGGASGSVRRAPATRTRSRKTKRRTRTVIVEYEVRGKGKTPITRTKRVKTSIRKKRKTKKQQPRTAARRTHVLASVRAKLATVRSERALGAPGPSELAARRAGAGIPSLSLFGSANQFEYFAEDDEDSGGGPTGGSATALASRPTPAAFNAYRQTRRKMVSIGSPAHASAAPDLLGDILARQEALHSHRSLLSVTVDGDVKITVQTKAPPADSKPSPPLGEGTAGEAGRQAPSYPGQGRGWGGGYRYPREQNHTNNQNNHSNQGHQGNQGYGRDGYDNGFGGPGGGYGGPGGGPHDRRDDHNGPFMDYNNRRPHYNDEEPWHDRNRRPQPEHNMRGNNNMPRNDERRYSSGGAAWQGAGGPRREPPQRHSFGGYDAALDMRTAPQPRAAADKSPTYAPLPEPPGFPLDAAPPTPPAPEEDERSDEGLVIDTEKYDPTSPTHDEDSPAASPAPAPPPPPPFAPAALSPSLAAGVQSILASMEARGLGVPPAAVLDSAVRAALHEHRALLHTPSAPAELGAGDCPNFSIYSATSVHIASDSSRGLARSPPQPSPPLLEDPEQREGSSTPPTPADDLAPPAPSPPADDLPPPTDEYKAKLSKRCPITANARNPIKIRLSGPTLIRRPVALYDDEDVEQIAETAPEQEAALEPEAEAPEPAPEPDHESAPEPEPESEPLVKPEDDDEAQSEIATQKLPIDADSEEKQTDEKEDEFEEELADEATVAPDEDGTPSAREEAEEEKVKSDSEGEASSSPRSPRSPRAPKMTESISETEDSRSYTPCLDERGLEPAEPGLEGLGTELISEEEANDMFSEASPPAPAPHAAAVPEDGEIPDKRRADDTKKKKKKDGKKDKEGKGKGKKARGDVAFKKATRVKERSYRERDKKEKRRSSSSVSRRRRKDKRKDLERYDVRTLVTERRRRVKDAFGRDVSPSRSPSAPRAASPDTSPRRARFSPSPPRRRASPTPPPRRARISPSPRRRASPSPRRARLTSPSPRRARLASPSPRRTRLASPSPRRARLASPSPRRASSAASPRRSPSPKRRRKRSGSRGAAARRRRSGSRARKRRRSPSPAASPKPAKQKKKKRSPRRRSQRRKRARRRSLSAAPAAAASWSPPPPERAPSPRTPPPAEPVSLEERRRRREVERAHRRLREASGPSKEVFTSGDNILVSVSFKETALGAGGIGRRARRAERRRRRRARVEPPAAAAAAKPVAIIDLERSPFRELTPSPKNVIVLSDDEAERAPPAAPAAPAPPAALQQGPKTPPEPAGPAPQGPSDSQAPSVPVEGDSPRGPLTPPEPPDSPDAYDPFEPTRSPSPPAAPAAPAAAPAPAAPADPERPSMTLEAAQKTHLSADELLDRRPLSPIEKVMALLQSTRDVSPEEPEVRAAGASPGGSAGPPAAESAGTGGGGPLAAVAPAPRVLLPDAPRPTPKLFLAKPSPIKSDPIKPMPQQQATKISRLPLPLVVGVRRASLSLSRSPSPMGGASPYSPGESDFGDLFEPPPPAHRASRRRNKNGKNKRTKRGGRTTVEVLLDDDSLKVMEELPSSAVEMEVKSKFLKKLNRQERVVEEVKLVLKPHYNKKHVSKDEYKHILRRAVPKICHNKNGEINPSKIQALVEAYVKKFRKKRKLGQ